jgi:hypothetical protein
MSLSIPLEKCHVPTQFATISPLIGSIKLYLMPQPNGRQCTMAIITFPKHNHHSKLKDAYQPPTHLKACEPYQHNHLW